jgi:hypothetical protein
MTPADVATPRPAMPAAIAAPVPAPGQSLPPIVELVYSAFWGSRGFIVGTVGYRFEHDGQRYSIETVGTAYGLIALLFPGQLRVESRGALTAAGLVPEELRVARGRADREEVARFDRSAGMLTLHDKPPLPMDAPTYDMLTFWLQFYFAPPAGDEVSFRVATTRQVREYRLRRAGTESVATPLGTVDTEVWERVIDDRKDPGAKIWLAPLWHYLPVKVRLSGRRGSVEQLLIGVRTGLDVPESVSSRERLTLPLDAEGRDVQEPVPAEQRHTP